MRIFEIATPKDTKVLKTEKGSVVKRYPKLGVGKPMGGAVYIHKYYENLLPDAFNHYKEILSNQFPDYEYNIVKFGKDGASFLYSPDFDTAEEPVVESYVTVKSDGFAKPGKSKTIYHHKWLFVKDDYPGFDVDKSFERSKAWLQIPSIPFSKIGQNKEYWNGFLQQNKDHLPSTFTFESKYYTGKALETGKTSTNFKGAAPGLQLLVKKGAIKKDMTVLDYGAGKYGRNSVYLRNLGFKTYAYDPFNGFSTDGWNEVSTSLPNEKFDVGFTAFVLNVVPYPVELNIIQDLNSRCNHTYHIVRNNDVFTSVKQALFKQDKIVWPFFNEHFLKDNPDISEENLSDEIIHQFCVYGVQTSKGFQRICNLEDHGFQLIKGSFTSPYKVYSK